MMRAKCAVAALSLMSLSALAAETTYQFDSVSKVSFYGGWGTTTTITGLLVNDSVPTSVAAPAGYERCEDLMMEMIKNPGMYLLSVTIVTTIYPPDTVPTVVSMSNCILEAKS